MRRTLAIGLVLVLAAIAYAAGSGKEVKVTGYLIDNACAAANADKPDKAEKIKNHPVSCALMENCRKSGYALFAEDKVYKLDENGNKQVGSLFKEASRSNRKGLQVSVEGTIEGDILQVKKISVVEASAK